MVPIVFVTSWLPTLGASPPVAREPKAFARTNPVAWCIVSFDGKKRGQAERAAMLKELGFPKERSKLQWDHDRKTAVMAPLSPGLSGLMLQQ
jgi:hypothetical protein